MGVRRGKEGWNEVLCVYVEEGEGGRSVVEGQTFKSFQIHTKDSELSYSHQRPF